jgi:hypothetical protein
MNVNWSDSQKPSEATRVSLTARNRGHEAFCSPGTILLLREATR